MLPLSDLKLVCKSVLALSILANGLMAICRENEHGYQTSLKPLLNHMRISVGMST